MKVRNAGKGLALLLPYAGEFGCYGLRSYIKRAIRRAERRAGRALTAESLNGN